MDNEDWVMGLVIGVAILLLGACIAIIPAHYMTKKTYETTIVLCNKGISRDDEDGTYSGSAIDAQGNEYSFSDPNFYNWLTIGTTYRMTVEKSVVTSVTIQNAKVVPATASTGTCPVG